MKVVLILKIILWALIVAGFVAMIALPLYYQGHTRFDVLPMIARGDPVPYVLCSLMLVDALGLWICAELLRMLQTIRENPFVMRNVNALTRIGWVAMALLVIALVLGLPSRDMLTLACGGAMAILGLFAMTLSQLFRQAVLFKEENDLTI